MTLALGACAASSTPSPAGPGAPASAAASAAASSGGGGAAACAPAQAGATPTVTVTIKDMKYSSEPVTAKVGDVIGWTNNDSVQHTATLDDGTCTTDQLANGQTGALVFSVAGTYPYHCKVHPTTMKGTITVTG
jgi:plastocyanin